MIVYLYLNWKVVVVVEILKSNVFVFDLPEFYVYLIPKCVFEPNPGPIVKTRWKQTKSLHGLVLCVSEKFAIDKSKMHYVYVKKHIGTEYNNPVLFWRTMDVLVTEKKKVISDGDLTCLHSLLCNSISNPNCYHLVSGTVTTASLLYWYLLTIPSQVSKYFSLNPLDLSHF